jgi:predicted HD phosphohydrolase
VYRARQFARYLRGARLDPAEQEQVRARLGPRLAELFARMSPGEQAHSLRVAQTLLARGETTPDLLAAALLHDVGKTRAPVSLPGRVLAVLGQR